MKEGRIYTGDELAQDLALSCDVCIVGSGSGGGWLAHELSARGLSVVMLEEGGYFTRRDFKLDEAHAFTHFYQELGNRTTDDLAVGILQGRSVGGGTTVNWSTSFRAPKRILELWRDRFGVEGLSHEALAPHWEAIEERLSIAEWPKERMNRNNRILWEGLGKLGYHRGLLSRNVRHCADLGYCGMGCPIDAKQSTLVTVIPDAVKKGLSLYANVSVRRLEVSHRRVVAVHGEVLHPERDEPTGRKVVVRAKVTALSCGAINTPALLLRSELTGNGRVGKRTYLHPFTATLGIFDEPVEPFAGAPQAVYSHQFAQREKGQMGFFLEVGPLFPMTVAVLASGFGRPLQEMMAQLSHMNAIGCPLVDGVEEGDEGGTVKLRTQGYGRVSFDYPLTERHLEAFRTACRETARLQLRMGAKRVYSLHFDPVVLESENDLPKLDAAPWEKLRLKVLTAHQMGGCAMGKSPHTSVVDSRLRYHGLDNLFVVDGSVFPTGLGVNPQETIFALARWGAQHVAAAVG
ncbi:MAG: GMC family oxidoreductase N-terminal domain-containing protein [Myxococcota bacterium]